MFNSISWKSPWTNLVLKKEFREKTFNQALNLPDADTVLNTCMDDIHAFFQGSKRRRTVKDELIADLQKILTKYSSLKNSHDKEIVTRLIRAESNNLFSINLKENEVRRVWLKA